MVEQPQQICPECHQPAQTREVGLNRRGFIRVLGGTAASLLAGGAAAPQLASAAPAAAPTPPLIPSTGPKPAEELVRELYNSLTQQQRSNVVYTWNHGQSGNQLPTRLRFFNQAFGPQVSSYTAAQRDLLQRIFRGVVSQEDGFDRFSNVLRSDNWNNSGFNGAGAAIFGNPNQGQFAWLFTAHHITLRCDGNSKPDAAFGGPMYYGHSVDGYSVRNAWNFQTKSVQTVYEGLSDAQRRRALITNGTPGENYDSVRFRAASATRPGLPITELSRTQRMQVYGVMRDLLKPFRKEESDEAMELLNRSGGLDRVSLAFYRDRGTTDNSRWHFWRLEGPGFVWNYRILPHVHCYVNVGVPRA